jgi:hypothetical protein
MYEMSQRQPFWVAENHVKPCNSVCTLTHAQLHSHPNIHPPLNYHQFRHMQCTSSSRYSVTKWIFFEGLIVLCADGFQVFLKLFTTRYNYNINILFASLKFLPNFVNAY